MLFYLKIPFFCCTLFVWLYPYPTQCFVTYTFLLILNLLHNIFNNIWGIGYCRITGRVILKPFSLWSESFILFCSNVQTIKAFVWFCWKSPSICHQCRSRSIWTSIKFLWLCTVRKYVTEDVNTFLGYIVHLDLIVWLCKQILICTCLKKGWFYLITALFSPLTIPFATFHKWIILPSDYIYTLYH